jgi:dihydropteroate synthase
LARVIPIVDAIRKVSNVVISIDTTKASVAREAIAHGADIINDITAMLGDAEMPRVIADSGAGVILMHMRGTPRSMQTMTDYKDLAGEVEDYFRERLSSAAEAGIPYECICLDPGIGFAKGMEQNLDLLTESARFRALGAPIMIGTSRKAFIGKLTGAPAGRGRMEGSLAAATAAVLRGADIVRVHDVAETRRAMAVADALRARFI